MEYRKIVDEIRRLVGAEAEERGYEPDMNLEGGSVVFMTDSRSPLSSELLDVRFGEARIVQVTECPDGYSVSERENDRLTADLYHLDGPVSAAARFLAENRLDPGENEPILLAMIGSEEWRSPKRWIYLAKEYVEDK